MHTADEVAHRLAAAQRGAFARWQLAVGVTSNELIRRRISSGRWIRVLPGVYSLPGVAQDLERRLWVAWLAVGPPAVLSHETAAERHVMSGARRGRVVMIRKHGSHHRVPDVVVHQIDDLRDSHSTVVRGLPTTTPERTVVDLAAVLSLVRLRHVVDAAVAARRTTDRQVAAVLADVARPRKPGVKRLARVLDDRAPGRAVPESHLERMLLTAVRSAGNPEPVAQFDHPGRYPGPGRVDFAYPDAKLILEADGRRWHQRVADLVRDRARDNEAARAGWLTMRFMYEELTNDPDDVGRAVRDVRASRQ